MNSDDSKRPISFHFRYFIHNLNSNGRITFPIAWSKYVDSVELIERKRKILTSKCTHTCEQKNILDTIPFPYWWL